MKRVLVLGANGFIGSHVVNNLRESDEYQPIRASRHGAAHREDIALDFTDPASFPDPVSVPRIGAVINCAAMIHGAAPDLLSVNCQGLQNCIAWARAAGCRRFIHLSSIQVIGVPLYQPIDEDHPCAPRSFYHVSKLCGEHILNLPENEDIKPAILRVPSPLGPGMNPETIIPTFLDRALHNRDLVLHGDGSRLQTYMDARDIAAAIRAALDSGCAGIFNLTGISALSNLEAARACRDYCGSQSRIIFSGKADPQNDHKWVVSGDKFFAHSGFRAGKSFADSLAYIANGQISSPGA